MMAVRKFINKQTVRWMMYTASTLVLYTGLFYTSTFSAHARYYTGFTINWRWSSGTVGNSYTTCLPVGTLMIDWRWGCIRRIDAYRVAQKFAPFFIRYTILWIVKFIKSNKWNIVTKFLINKQTFEKHWQNANDISDDVTRHRQKNKYVKFWKWVNFIWS